MRGPRSAGGRGSLSWHPIVGDGQGPAEMKRNRQCPECSQPVSRRRFRAALMAHEMLGVRDRLSTLDLEMEDFCARGVELASSLHAASHAGRTKVRLVRRSKRWLREGRAMARSADSHRPPPPIRPEDDPQGAGADLE